jgi:hydrogenase maturation protein HypF
VDRKPARPSLSSAPGLAIRISGIVQGVGFRPFIYRLAAEHGLRGFVSNTPEGVLVEVTGAPPDLAAFLRAIPEKKPPLARITEISAEPVAIEPREDFSIQPSRGDEKPTALIPPDVATCPLCLAELFDPANRRHRYAFINCTDCGPRYTLIRALPYDRPLTTMASFTLCRDCRKEYEDPLDRRFHAQPNACPACGPELTLFDAKGERIPSADPVADLAARIQAGEIAAVKGLGGFHLAADATNQAAVLRLRERKQREEKPLALMAFSLERVREFCRVTEEEAALLQGPEKPIVLLEKRTPHRIAPSVAPGQAALGVMLPYSPLHALLLQSLYAIVLTSGNRTDEPIAFQNTEALERLAGIADVFLVHDRDIHRRADDSVARMMAGRPQILRRARGYAPRPVRLSLDAPPLLATGGQLKNTVCLTRGREAFLSPHLGDLDNLEAYRSFEETVAHLSRTLEIQPVAVVHDLHPDYLSTRWALERSGLPTLGVQHHHAHLAAVLAEHGLEGPVVGLALDGTGYGTDGEIWGGEVLVADLNDFTRAAHLPYLPLLGGEAATRENWRMALAWLYRLFGRDFFSLNLPFLSALNKRPAGLLLDALESGMAFPRTSSCGRLFDAIAALTGVRLRMSFEGQAPMELEGRAASFPLEVPTAADREPRGSPEIPVDRTVRLAIEEIVRGESAAEVAARFHARLAAVLAASAAEVARERGLRQIALGGGCFQNRILLTRVVEELSLEGFEVLVPLEVPANDGGIALGQAAVAARRLR